MNNIMYITRVIQFLCIQLLIRLHLPKKNNSFVMKLCKGKHIGYILSIPNGFYSRESYSKLSMQILKSVFFRYSFGNFYIGIIEFQHHDFCHKCKSMRKIV